jgi:soluble lytic murein transglycosylase-like protein
MTRLVLLLVILSIAVPAGSYQGFATATVPALPPATPPDLSTIPDAWRAMIIAAATAKGVPVLALAGLASAESDFAPAPTHKDPMDRGMFGLREAPGYHEERIRKYGEFDPEIPDEAARVAAGILRDHLTRFDGYMPLALTAYHRGAGWAEKHGVDWVYVERATL